MRTQQIQAEWRRARRALRAAETLRAERLPEDAVSRAYYAVLHAAKAALLARETVAETHAGVRRLFGKDLITTGELEAEWGQVLSRIQDQRSVADYNVDVDIEGPVADELIADATRFVERVARYRATKQVSLPDDP
jgi:uncharacterized protein